MLGTAHPIVQSLIDGVRVLAMVWAVVLCIFAFALNMNPKVRAMPDWPYRNLAMTIFVLIIFGTELDRFGHDMGYWRLPLSIVGLVLATIAVARLYLYVSAPSGWHNPTDEYEWVFRRRR